MLKEAMLSSIWYFPVKRTLHRGSKNQKYIAKFPSSPLLSYITKVNQKYASWTQKLFPHWLVCSINTPFRLSRANFKNAKEIFDYNNGFFLFHRSNNVSWCISLKHIRDHFWYKTFHFDYRLHGLFLWLPSHKYGLRGLIVVNENIQR